VRRDVEAVGVMVKRNAGCRKATFSIARHDQTEDQHVREKHETRGQDRAALMSAVNATSRKAYLRLAQRQMRRADETKEEWGI
jgi:hypothetical protein